MFECCIAHCRNYAGMPPLFLHQRIYIKSIAYLLYQSTEHEEDACQHPGLDSGESLRLGSVGGDGVEDVDQHQEQSDKKGLGGKTFFLKLTLNGITKNEQKGPFLFLKSLKSDL